MREQAMSERQQQTSQSFGQRLRENASTFISGLLPARRPDNTDICTPTHIDEQIAMAEGGFTLTPQNQPSSSSSSSTGIRRLGIMEKGCFFYMRWNQERKFHEKTQQEHLTISQAKEHIAMIIKHLVFPRVILRFHALRKLTSEMTSEVVPFTLEIHNRCLEFQHTYSAFGRLAFNSVLHLIGGSVRPCKLGRGPLERP